MLVVENLDAFALRYGNDLPVTGQWQGRLSNGGEVLRLSAGEQTIHQFAYDDQWPAQTDGAGASLEIIDERHADLSRWMVGTNWQASGNGGTPGTAKSERAM